jgi:periplasmic mercuric ion binding protein
MNFLKSILTITLASIMFVGCKEKMNDTVKNSVAESNTPKVKKEIAPANLQTASFNIKGMTCAIGCAKTIQEELNGLDGVKMAKVDFDKELATVSFDKTILNAEKLSKVVEAAADGKTYVVSNIK